MLHYQRERLERDFVPDVRSSFLACSELSDASMSEEFSSVHQQLSSLKSLIFDHSSQSLLERHKSLVAKAFLVRSTKGVHNCLVRSSIASSRTRRLWESIYFLARIQVAFQIFLKIASDLPAFAHVTIHLVPITKAPRNALPRALTLKQTFELLKLSLNAATIETMLDPKWTVQKATTRFAEQQEMRLNIHAEVQMVIFLCQHEEIPGCFPYFGCSKYSCFMCFHSLEAFGTIKTRGCHGRLFKPWTVPESLNLTADDALKIARAIQQLQKDVKKELKPVRSTSKLQKASVVGGTTVWGHNGEGSEIRKKEVERWEVKATQDRFASQFNR